ncbi:MAG TPA: peptidoglycan-binding domain-containing protein [Chthoniobacterales bacterium]|nr:peptidoglycan-binding domain-containing protein [Chthoniobacterales bacterium]
MFVNGSWGGLDAGVFPWDYYPYDAYDYYPYDYAVDGLENAPPDYAVGSVDNVPTDDHAPPQPDVTVSSVQTQLTQLGYYNGPVDGLFGPTTRDAVARYQTDQNLEVTGSLSPETLQSLKVPGKTDSN